MGDATKKPWQKNEFCGHVDEEQDTQLDVVAVSATSCVQDCDVDHRMDTWSKNTVRDVLEQREREGFPGGTPASHEHQCSRGYQDDLVSLEDDFRICVKFDKDPSTPEQSDLAQEMCSTLVRPQREKVGTGPSRQAEIQTSNLGAHLRKITRPACSHGTLQHHSRIPRHSGRHAGSTGREGGGKRSAWRTRSAYSASS